MLDVHPPQEGDNVDDGADSSAPLLVLHALM